MNKTLTYAATFLLGAAAGAAGSWYILKTKYAQIAQDEIDSVKEVFSKKMAERNTQLKENHPITEEQSADEPKEESQRLKIYSNLVEKQDYTSYSSDMKNPEVEKQEETETVLEPRPYVIPPEEFGEFHEYEQIELTFFRDQILVDDQFELLEDVDNVVGFESLSHFGEYEDDSVFVRNDRLKCDYEILLDGRTYSEARKEKPPVKRGRL